MRPRHRIALLEQQPRILALQRLLDAHQFPLASQLVTVQTKDELALSQSGARVVDGRPCAAVPNDDVAGAVLLGRDRAFERCVRQRMVFGAHRQAFVDGVEAGAARHRPRQQDAVEFKPEVVVQTRRAVLLDHECECVAAAGGTGLRLGRQAEVALGAVRLQSVASADGCDVDARGRWRGRRVCHQ